MRAALAALALLGCVASPGPDALEPGELLDNEGTRLAMEATIASWEANVWPLQPHEHQAIEEVPIYVTVCPDCIPGSRMVSELGACSIAAGQVYIQLFDHVPYEQATTDVLVHEYGHKLQWYVFGVVDGEHADALVWSTIVPQAGNLLKE